jgi:hypothetical protein
MKNITLLVGICFVLLKAESQNVFPSFSDSANWSVLRCYSPPNPCYTDFYSYSYDTTFCGHTYSVVDSLDAVSQGYFRSDSLRTYYRKSTNCADKEYLIYDYSVSVGDTIWVGNSSGAQPDTTQFLVDTVEFVNYSGVMRKRIKLLYNPCFSSPVDPLGQPMYWIQGIGSDVHPFYSLFCLCDGCEVIYTTLCYDSSSVELYKNSLFDTCDTIIPGGVDDLNGNPQISVFPNPTSDIVHISISNSHKSNGIIYSYTGQVIQQFNMQNSIALDVKNLPPGIYLIWVSTDNGIRRKRFVKEE